MKIETKKKIFGDDEFKVTNWETACEGFNVSDLPFGPRHLQIDGGGVLGVMAAFLLMVTENKNPGFLQSFSEFWGTSTGSIIAACVNLFLWQPDKINLKQTFEFYGTEAPRLFDDKSFMGKLFTRSLFKSDKIKQKFDSIFGDLTFLDLHHATGKKLNIAVFDVLRRKTIILNYVNAPDMKIADAVMQSISAPMYFPRVHWRREVRADGGTGTKNCMLDDVMDEIIFENEGAGAVLSLGCGRTKRKQDNFTDAEIKDALNDGKVAAVEFVLSAGREEMVRRQESRFEKLIKKKKIRGVRWNIELSKELNQMSETDNFASLVALVDRPGLAGVLIK
jgi:patatin-like phospholipase/acyl hydrolase